MGAWKHWLGFTQRAWRKLIRVIRCSLTVVLPLKWRPLFLSLLLSYHLTFWRLHGHNEKQKKRELVKKGALKIVGAT